VRSIGMADPSIPIIGFVFRQCRSHLPFLANNN
jgi:hypothetical protein